MIGIAVDGVFTGVALAQRLTALLAILLSIGLTVSGVLIVLVAYSTAPVPALAIAIYCVVRIIDGHLTVAMMARRSAGSR